MFYLVFGIHILICLCIIGVVLLQQGKGAEAGAVFGSSSDSVVGAGSAPSFFTKFTTSLAIAFMVSSILLVKAYAGHTSAKVVTETDLLKGSVISKTLTEEEKINEVATDTTTASMLVDQADNDSNKENAVASNETREAIPETVNAENNNIKEEGN